MGNRRSCHIIGGDDAGVGGEHGHQILGGSLPTPRDGGGHWLVEELLVDDDRCWRVTHTALVVVGHGHGIAQSGEGCNPVDALVEAVPDNGEVTAVTQHASDLSAGRNWVEPVPRRAHDYEVNAGIGERKRFSSARECGHRRRPLREHLAHGGVWFNGGDGAAEVDEGAGGESGACCEIDHRTRRCCTAELGH